MRIWLSKSSGASLRDQLATQLMLAVISGELAPGEKLPSVRELARRYKIHANTVSAAYRDLASRGWVTLRKGSGVYAVDVSARPQEESSLDSLIESFLKEARAEGFSRKEVEARLRAHLKSSPARRIVIFEPEPELRDILKAELRMHFGQRVSDAKPPQSGAVTAALSSRNRALGDGMPRFLLRPRSLQEHFAGQTRPPDFALVGVASSSPEILRMARTLLIAAGLSADALEFRDAREQGWLRGLTECSFVIADERTAARLPKSCDKRIFRVLSDASIAELRAFVTAEKVS